MREEEWMRILIVEDSKMLRFMVVKMLQDAGYKDVTGVTSAEEALRVINENKPDLILLDWNLPKMSGFDLLQQIRKSSELSGLNVVMVTTEHDKGNILLALKVGLQGYILKPVNQEALLGKVKQIEGKLSSTGLEPSSKLPA
jgi:two-component system chemotaxis response regulator CheY